MSCTCRLVRPFLASHSKGKMLRNNVYVEKSLPLKEVIGLKICSHLSHDENAHLMTSTLIRHVDGKKLAQVAA
jgi:hypothetical protein